jgi:hypothetical protein
MKWESTLLKLLFFAEYISYWGGLDWHVKNQITVSYKPIEFSLMYKKLQKCDIQWYLVRCRNRRFFTHCKGTETSINASCPILSNVNNNFAKLKFHSPYLAYYTADHHRSKSYTFFLSVKCSLISLNIFRPL